RARQAELGAKRRQLLLCRHRPHLAAEQQLLCSGRGRHPAERLGRRARRGSGHERRSVTMTRWSSPPLCAVTLIGAGLIGLAAARADEPPDEPPAPEAALTRPPRLVRFVDAEPPARLVELGRADVVLIIDVDAAGAVTSVTVAE